MCRAPRESGARATGGAEPVEATPDPVWGAIPHFGADNSRPKRKNPPQTGQVRPAGPRTLRQAQGPPFDKLRDLTPRDSLKPAHGAEPVEATPDPSTSSGTAPRQAQGPPLDRLRDLALAVAQAPRPANAERPRLPEQERGRSRECSELLRGDHLKGDHGGDVVTQANGRLVLADRT